MIFKQFYPRTQIHLFMIFSSLAAIALSCASHVRKEPVGTKLLNEEGLFRINEEARFTRFNYSNDRIESGLMLRWMPDSILIQPRGQALPVAIPTSGLKSIEAVTGNRMFEGLAIGAVLGGLYFVIVRGYDLQQISFLEGIAKLLGGPAIILTSMGIGTSKEKYEKFVIPPGFKFDFEAAKSKFQNNK